MGISRPKLDCTSAGVRPTAVAACAKAAIAPQPMPRRYNVQKILALTGSRESRMPSMCRLLRMRLSVGLRLAMALEVHVDLELHLVAHVAAVEDRRVRLAVRECATGRVVDAVLQLDVDPVDRDLAACEED